MYPNIVTARTAIELLVLLLVAAAGSVVRSHPRLHSRLIRAPPALGVGNVQVLLVDRLDRSDSSHQLSRRSFEQVQDLDTELDASSELSEGATAESKREWRMHMSRPRTRTNAALAAAGGAGATATGPRPCTPEEMSRLQQQHGRQQRSHYNAWDPVLGFRASAGLPPVPCVPIGPAMPAPAAAPHAQPAAGAAGRHNAANGQRRDSESGFSFFRWGR